MSSSDDLIDHLLAVARERLGMEMSWLSSFVDGNQVFDRLSGPAASFGLKPGAESPLCDSYCARVLDGQLPNLIPDTSSNPVSASLAVTDDLGIGSYVGVPIRHADGTAQGMLCCINGGEAQHLADGDVHTLELIAQLLGEIVNTEGPALERRRSVTERVTHAIRHHQFRIVYQPVIDIASGTVVGVEALSRFEGGPTRPNAWFVEAASVGLGVNLELATLEAALAGLDELDPCHYLALNVSPDAVSDPRLSELLQTSDPSRIVLELTEHTAIASYDELCHALDELRASGLRIAVDDAGAGFSSLSHVLEIRPSLLKIDRSIVNGLELDPARVSLVKAITDIARRVDATVIAEGVESRAVLDCLGSMGITHAQGYFLGRPATLPTVSQAPSAKVCQQVEPHAGGDDEDVAMRRFELAMRHSPIGMALVSPNGPFLHANPAFETMVGASTEELAELTLADLLPTRQGVGVAKVVSDFLEGSRTNLRADRQFRLPGGQMRWGDLSVVLVHAEDQPAYFLVQLHDITDRRIREEHFAQLAGTDHLTALANRSAARTRLHDLTEANSQIAVMYCDLRWFKLVNDDYGHQAGDHVLQTIALRLAHEVPEGVVSRWGGDEFLIILEDASPIYVEGLRERIMAAVAMPIRLPDRVETVVPKITIGTATNDGRLGLPVDELVHCADTDMYRQRRMSTHPASCS